MIFLSVKSFQIQVDSLNIPNAGEYGLYGHTRGWSSQGDSIRTEHLSAMSPSLSSLYSNTQQANDIRPFQYSVFQVPKLHHTSLRSLPHNSDWRWLYLALRQSLDSIMCLAFLFIVLQILLIRERGVSDKVVALGARVIDRLVRFA